MEEIKNLKFKIKKFDTGFTLVELLVAVFLFSVITLIVAGIFVQALALERKAFSAQMIQENTLAVFELMAKEIRVGHINGPDSNCAINTLSITVLDSSGNPVNVTYQLDSSLGVVKRIYNGVTYFVSTNDVVFNSLKFCIFNSAIDNQPARVTVLASISNRIGKIVTANLQTTITSRDITAELEDQAP